MLPRGVAVSLNPIDNNRIDDQSGHPPSNRSPAPSYLDPETLELIRTLNPGVIEWIRHLDPAFLDEIRKIQELSLKEKEEKEEGKERETQEETEKERESEKSESGSGGGGNENGVEVVKEVVEESSTRNHPRRRENKQEIIVGDFVLEVSEDKAKLREGLAEKQDQTESKVSKDKAKQREQLAMKQDQTESKKKVSKEKAKQREEFAQKQDQTKIKTKVSKDKAKQREELAEKQDQTKSKKVSKDKAKERRELAEKQGQTKNKYCPGRRKGEPSLAPALKLNFLGLPIRPGKKDCGHYMRTGTCKYENNCLFNHPDPTPAEESRPQSAYESHGIHSETAEWNDVITPSWD